MPVDQFNDMLLLRILVPSLAALATAVAPSAAAESPRCGDSGYSYAGLIGVLPSFGVVAELRMEGQPDVRSGHVAGWVGVGGYGFGPGGTDAWLQSGLISYPDGSSAVYYEFTRPGFEPELVYLRSAEPWRSYRIAVVEITGRPSWWRVLLDRRPVSKPISLPGSHGAWEPIATAEGWDGGVPACNRFTFGFARLAVVLRPGGNWAPLAAVSTLQAPGYRVIDRTPSGFLARN